MNDERPGDARASGGEHRFLLVRCGRRACAIPAQQVDEVMRPLPIEPLTGTAGFIAGASIVRGRATPIVDAATLLSEDSPPPGRLVMLRVDDERLVGMLVTGTLGLRSARELPADPLPPLLEGAAEGTVEALARLDGRLLTVLNVIRALPDEVWSDDPSSRAAAAREETA